MWFVNKASSWEKKTLTEGFKKVCLNNSSAWIRKTEFNLSLLNFIFHKIGG